MSKKITVLPSCAVDFAFKRIGGKYKGRIIWYIHNNKHVLRYGELRRLIKDITPKMLTQTLRELEEDGLVHRAVFNEVPPRVEYSLTDTGRELIPFIEYLRDWGEKQIARPEYQQLLKNHDQSMITCN